ncbi:MAG: disulfide bond formation protein B [Pseudomonadota bacterium]
MTTHRLIVLAALGSIALLGGAYAFQHLGGLAPCKMCLWQRWPHAAAITIAALALAFRLRALAWLGALAALITAGIGAYHVGVEQKWWEGPSSCSGGASLSGLSGGDLLSTAEPTGIVMCDEIAWSMLGISMPGWNALISLVLVGLWLAAARRKPA